MHLSISRLKRSGDKSSAASSLGAREIFGAFCASGA
jgi:hypothetical protein